MKIENILYPIDFSNSSLALNSDVEWLAKHYKAQVIVLNAFEVPTSWYGSPQLLTSESFAAYVKAGRERLKHYHLALPEDQIRRISVDGNPAWNIAQCVKNYKVDLIVMGTHGNGDFPRSLLGSVTMKVLHEVQCPVWTYSALVTDGGRKPGIARILCFIDISDETISLLQFTQQLAEECKAEVLVVHSVPALQSNPHESLQVELNSRLKNLYENDIAELQVQAGTRFPVRVTEQAVARNVAKIAAEQNADLIVTGRGVVQESFGTWRTDIYEIIRQAPCPVLSYSGQGQELAPVASTHEAVGPWPATSLS